MFRPRAGSIVSAGPGAPRSDGNYGAEEDGTSAEGDDRVIGGRKTTRGMVEDSVFGVLYTLGREKSPKSRFFATFQITVDYLQLFVFLFSSSFPWGKETTKFISNILGYIQLQNPLSMFTYDIFLIGFCVLASVILFCVFVIVFVAYNFKTNKFPFLWPIRIMRVVIRLILSSFYISSLNVLLVAIDCTIVGEEEPYLDSFNESLQVLCWELPHVIVAIVAILMAVILTILAFFTVLVEFEPSPTTRDVTACPDSKAELQGFALRTIITLISVVLTSYVEILAVAYAGITLLLYLSVARNLPYYNMGTNVTKGALYGSLFWAACCLVMVVFLPKLFGGIDLGDIMTIALFGGLIPSGIIGGIFVYLICRRFDGRRYFVDRKNEETGEIDKVLERPERVIKTARNVEKLARFVRKDIDNKEYQSMGVAIYDYGLQIFKESSFLQLAFSHFNGDILGRSDRSSFHLDKARALNPNFRERFDIFCLERVRLQRLQANAHGTAMDLVSFIDFQNRYAAAIHNHKATLRMVRAFWRLLMRPQVSIRLLEKSFNDIDNAERLSEQGYQALLERFSNSAKVMRSYALFVLKVKNNPVKARKLLLEADRLEEASGAGGVEEVDGGKMTNFAVLDDKKEGVLVSNGLGLIEYANPMANKMLGYKTDELVGKNIKVIIPSPYVDNHDMYVRKHISSGKASVLGKKRRFDVKHKEGHCISVDLQVSVAEEMQGSQEATRYICTLRQFDEDEEYGKVSINVEGSIVAINAQTTELFGYSSKELMGHNVNVLMPMVMRAKHDDYIRRYVEKGKRGNFKMLQRRLTGVHKDGTEFPISVSLQDRGVGEKRVIEAVIRPIGTEIGAINTDIHGNITSISSNMALMFGYKEHEMEGMDIKQLMPMYYQRYHDQFLKRYRKTGGTGIINSHRERVVTVVHHDGSEFEVLLRLHDTEDATGQRSLTAAVSYYHPDRDPRCVKAICSKMGKIKSLSGVAWDDIFGEKKEEMQTSSLAGFCDWAPILRAINENARRSRHAFNDNESGIVWQWVEITNRRTAEVLDTVFEIAPATEGLIEVTVHLLSSYECILFVGKDGHIFKLTKGSEVVLMRDDRDVLNHPYGMFISERSEGEKDIDPASHEPSGRTEINVEGRNDEMNEGAVPAPSGGVDVEREGTASFRSPSLPTTPPTASDTTSAEEKHSFHRGSRRNWNLAALEGGRHAVWIISLDGSRHAGYVEVTKVNNEEHGPGSENGTTTDTSTWIVRLVPERRFVQPSPKEEAKPEAPPLQEREQSGRMGQWLQAAGGLVGGGRPICGGGAGDEGGPPSSIPHHCLAAMGPMAASRGASGDGVAPQVETSSIVGTPLPGISESNEGEEERTTKEKVNFGFPRRMSVSRLSNGGADPSVALDGGRAEQMKSPYNKFGGDDYGHDSHDDDDNQSISLYSEMDNTLDQAARQKRRMDRLQRLLHSKPMRVAVTNLRKYTKVTLLCMLIASLFAYIAVQTSYNEEAVWLRKTAYTADVSVSLGMIHSLALELRTSLYLQEANSSFTTSRTSLGEAIGFERRGFETVQTDLRLASEECLSTAKRVGFEGGVGDAQLNSIFGQSELPFLRYVDSGWDPIPENFSSWEMVWEFCSVARHVALLENPELESLERDPFWKTVLLNFWSPMYDALHAFLDEEELLSTNIRQKRIAIRLVCTFVEVVYLIVALALLGNKFMKAVVDERIRLFQLFVKLPIKCMKVMLQKKEKIGDESGEESSSSTDEEEDDKGKRGSTNKPPVSANVKVPPTSRGHHHHQGQLYRKAPTQSGSKTEIYERKLTGVGRFSSKRYILALGVYGIFVVFTAVLSSVIMSVAASSYHSMHLSSHRLFSGAAIRTLSIELASFPTWSTSQRSPRLVTEDDLRTSLLNEAGHLKMVHNLLVHDEDSPVPSALLTPYQRSLLLDSRCLRPKTNDCLSEEHPFRSQVYAGLDSLVKEYTARATALARLRNSSLSLGDRNFGFIWQIMPMDLNYGLNASTNGLLADAYILQNVETVLEGVSIAVLVFSLLFYYIRILRPFLKKTESENIRAAILIGFMPDIPEMDAFLVRMKKIHRNSNASAIRQSTYGCRGCLRRVITFFRPRKDSVVVPLHQPVSTPNPNRLRRMSDSLVTSAATILNNGRHTIGGRKGHGRQLSGKYRSRSQTTSPRTPNEAVFGSASVYNSGNENRRREGELHSHRPQSLPMAVDGARAKLSIVTPANGGSKENFSPIDALQRGSTDQLARDMSMGYSMEEGRTAEDADQRDTNLRTVMEVPEEGRDSSSKEGREGSSMSGESVKGEMSLEDMDNFEMDGFLNDGVPLVDQGQSAKDRKK